MERIQRPEKSFTIVNRDVAEKSPLHDYLLSIGKLNQLIYNNAIYLLKVLYTGARAPQVLEERERIMFARLMDHLDEFNRQKDMKEPGFSSRRPNLAEQYLHTFRFLDSYLRAVRSPTYMNPELRRRTREVTVQGAVRAFINYVRKEKSYQRHPERFKGPPRSPQYKTRDKHAFSLSRYDVGLIPAERSTYEVMLPNYRILLPFTPPVNGKLLVVNAVPYYNSYQLKFVFSDSLPPPATGQTVAAIDIGISNLIAMVTNNGYGLLVKGGAVKSRLDWYDMQLAKLEKNKPIKPDRRILDLYAKRDRFLKDHLHKVSKRIIEICLEQNVGEIIIGKSKDWKARIYRHKSNEIFFKTPHELLNTYLTYKAHKNGLKVGLQEESYTSAASALDSDPLPDFKKGQKPPKFSGKRITRGLYETKDGKVINADLNGALNIMRKAKPGIDFEKEKIHYLVSPEVLRGRHFYA